MSFLSPFFLFALIAVGLPLLIHLLNLREPKRIQFSTLAFFKELQKSTIRKIRIKRWLLLTLRVLAIVSLALVLARPFLPPVMGLGSDTNQPAINAILLDNSISMARIGSKGPLFDQAKDVVQSLASSSGEQDRFLLQETNGEALPVSVYSAGQILRRMDDIEILQSGSFVQDRVQSLVEVLEQSPYVNKRLFVVSDDGVENPELIEALSDLPSTIGVSVIHVEDAATQNTFVTGLSSRTSMVAQGVPFSMQVSVKNAGDVLTSNQFVTLELNGQTSGQYPLQLGPGEVRNFDFNLNPETPGSLNGRILIEGDEFNLDNEYYFSIEVPSSRRILWVNGYSNNEATRSYLEPILEAPDNEGSQLIHQDITADELSAINFDEYDAVVFDGLDEIPEYTFTNLREYVQQGHGILFFPSETGDIVNYNRFLSQFNAGQVEGLMGAYGSFEQIASGSELLEDHPVFNGLFDRTEDEELSFTRPDIYYYLKINSPGASGFNLISLNNGDVLVKERPFGQGKLIVSAIGNDPGWSNFPVKALYPPFYYRAMLYASSSRNGGFSRHTLGNNFSWTGDLNPADAEIVANNQSIKVSNQNLGGAVRIEYSAREWVPGWVEVKDEDQSYTVAANLDVRESDFKAISSTIQDQFDDLDQVRLVDISGLSAEELPSAVRSGGFGKEIWHWFMLAGLLFLMTETLVSVFYKAETVS